MTAQLDTVRWGFSSLGAPEKSLTDLAHTAAAHGIPCLELRTLNGTIDLPVELEKQFPNDTDPRPWLADHKVEIICLNSSFKLTQSPESDRETLAAFARWADRLGAPYIRVFGGGKWGDAVEKPAFDRARDHISWWNGAKAGQGWKSEIVLETHDAFSGSTECLGLFEEIGQPLPMIWDTHHTWKLAGESPRESWAKIGQHVRHLHVKDSVSRPSDRHPYTYVHLGEGEFPFTDLFGLIKEVEYRGVIALEWEKLWHAYLDPMEEALGKARSNGFW